MTLNELLRNRGRFFWILNVAGWSGYVLTAYLGALAHNMDLKVVAEGIEDEETLRQISKMGCEEAQGYFLSKPVPSDRLIDWL